MARPKGIERNGQLQSLFGKLVHVFFILMKDVSGVPSFLPVFISPSLSLTCHAIRAPAPALNTAHLDFVGP